MPTLSYTVEDTKAILLDMIPAAAAHNAECRPNPIFLASKAMVESGEYTLITALYMEINERISRALVEQALIELSAEGKIVTISEAAQRDLTEYDRMLALPIGNREHHWIKVL